jgi:3-methyladenine DNA glycosylase/8-oxoguanine DNA glycosylase
MSLPFDPRDALRHLRRADPTLARVIRRVGPFPAEPPARMSIFAALLVSIVHQQLSGKAAATIHGRVVALYGPRGAPRPEDLLSTSDEDLRRAGLSRGKTLAVKDLAAKCASGIVPSMAHLRRMPDELVIERLTAVRGVGRWTAEMVLMFRLVRPDVLPIDDLGIRKGFQRVYGRRQLPTPFAVARYGERWRPYRTVASWYLWRSLESPP